MASGLWLWKLTKLGVVGGAVYVTVSGGVWSQETNQVRSLIDKYRGPLVHLNDAEQPLAIFYGCTAWFVSALAENPEDQFSHNEAHNYILDNVIKPELVRYKVAHVNEAEQELNKPWGETWNKGVQTVFAAVARSPDVAVDYTKKALKTTKDLMDGKKL